MGCTLSLLAVVVKLLKMDHTKQLNGWIFTQATHGDIGMNENILRNAKEILANNDELKKFADLNRISAEAAKQVLERLLEKPEVAEEFKEYIFSSERSEDFKGYTAGEEKGYQRGHEAGFAKGTALGVLGTIGLLTLAGLTYLAGRR